MIDSLLAAWALKDVARAGWLRHDVPRVESVAAHSWGVATLVLTLLPADLDRARALTYATLHDLAEARVGDITPFDGVSAADKHRAEATAMSALCDGLPNGAQLLASWRAYEAQSDDEARFVKQLDRLDMALQAVVYERSTGTDLAEFLHSARAALSHRALIDVFEALIDARGHTLD